MTSDEIRRLAIDHSNVTKADYARPTPETFGSFTVLIRSTIADLNGANVIFGERQRFDGTPEYVSAIHKTGHLEWASGHYFRDQTDALADFNGRVQFIADCRKAYAEERDYSHDEAIVR